MSTQQLPQSTKSEVEFTPFGAESSIKLSIQIIRNYVAIPTRNNNLPDDRECMRFLMLCRSRRLNPFEGDCFLQGYEGRNGAEWSLITAHQAFLKRAELHGEYDGMKSGVIVKDADGKIADREGDFTFDDDELLGAWAMVFFKQRKYPMQKRLKLKTFRKNFGRWVDDPAGMIVKCAEADALRSSFPTLLGGLYSEQEIARYDAPTNGAKAPDMSDIPPLPVKRAAVVETQAPAQKTEGTKPEGTHCKYCGSEVTDMAQHMCEPMRAQIEKERKAKQNQPAATTAPTPDAPQESGEGTGAPTPAPSLDEAKEALASIRLMAQQNGVTEAQVLKFCVANKLAKDGQSLQDLATSKLSNLNKKFLSLLPEIQKQPA